MRIIFMGTPDFSVPILRALVDAGHEVVCVYSQPPRPAGRGKKERPSPVQSCAEELGLPIRYPLNFKAPEDIDAFAALEADIAVVVAYGLILPQALLDAPTDGCLNIHASLLPRWRGAAPIQRAIIAGDAETGVCIMQMEVGLDTGPVLMQESLSIAADETAGSLHDGLSDLGAEAIVKALSSLGKLTPKPQDSAGVTYAKKIAKSEAHIDWSRNAQEVDQLIRGLSPFPGAWFELNGERIKVLNSKTVDAHGKAGVALDDDLAIACGKGAVRLTRLQRAGKGPMNAPDFQRGFQIPAGSILS